MTMCFVKKCHDNKNVFPPSHLYKEYIDIKMRNTPTHNSRYIICISLTQEDLKRIVC